MAEVIKIITLQFYFDYSKNLTSTHYNINSI